MAAKPYLRSLDEALGLTLLPRKQKVIRFNLKEAFEASEKQRPPDSILQQSDVLPGTEDEDEPNVSTLLDSQPEEPILSTDVPDPVPPEDLDQQVPDRSPENVAVEIGNVVGQLKGILGKWDQLAVTMGLNAPEISEYKITLEDGETTLGELWGDLGQIAKELPATIAQLNEKAQLARQEIDNNSRRQEAPIESPEDVSRMPTVPDLTL
jgi:hypothetical protein